MQNIKFKIIIPISLLFGFSYVIGDIFVYYPKNGFNFITFVNGLLLSFLFALFFILFIKGLTNPILQRPIAFVKPIKQNLFRNTFCLLLFMWIGHLIIKYPAGQCPDSYTQIQMGLHPDILTAHHPLISTLIVTRFVQFGELLGNRNVGIFIYVTLEALLLAAIFAYAVCVIYHKLSVPDTLLTISILFFGFSPYIVGYIGQAIKDVMYTAGFVLLLTIMIDHKTNQSGNSSALSSIWIIFKLLISVGLICFFRKEGIILLFFWFFLFSLGEIVKEKKFTATIPILLIIIFIPFLINHLCEQKYNPQKGSIREMLSLPFQQTARYISKHQNTISDDEIEAISKVLDISVIPERYISWNSDQIKELYKENATKEDLMDYFRAWFIGFTKAPLCYLRATMEQNIYLLYPGYNNYTYYIDANSGAAYLFGNARLFSTPDFILNLQSEYESFLNDMHTFPLLNVINNMVFYIWVLLVCTVVAINVHNKLFLQISIPLYLSIAIIIFAPCIRGSVRYAFPVIWSFPLWFCSLFNSLNNKKILG